MERREKSVPKVFKECLDLQVPWEIKDPLVNLDLEGILEKMDHQVCLALLVLLGQLENEALQAQVELEVSKECQVLLVILDSLVKMEMLEFLVNLE